MNQLPGECLGATEYWIRDLAHQPDLQRFCARKAPRRGKELQRARLSNQAWQSLSATPAGNYSQTGARMGKNGFARSDPSFTAIVANERGLRSAGRLKRMTASESLTSVTTRRASSALIRGPSHASGENPRSPQLRSPGERLPPRHAPSNERYLRGGRFRRPVQGNRSFPLHGATG